MEIPGKTLVPNQNGPKFAPKIWRRIVLKNNRMTIFRGKIWCLFQGGYCLIFQKFNLSKHIFSVVQELPGFLDANLKFSPKTLVFRGWNISWEKTIQKAAKTSGQKSKTKHGQQIRYDPNKSGTAPYSMPSNGWENVHRKVQMFNLNFPVCVA